MSRPLFRLKISGEPHSFRALVVTPGQVLLAQGNTPGKLLADWLGRFVASPAWDGNTIQFFVRDEQGRELSNVTCEPVTAADLRGPLKQEFAELIKCLENASPQSSQEKALHQFVRRGLLDSPTGERGAFVSLGCQLFKYQNVQGRTRLVWCYGFAPQVERGDARPVICPVAGCALLQMRHAESKPNCAGCGKSLAAAPRPRRLKKLVQLLLLLLVLLAGAGAAATWWLRPSAVIVGRVVREGDHQGVADAVVHLVGTDRQIQADATGAFRLERLPRGLARVSAAAPGFMEADAEVDLVNGRENQVELVLPGAARIMGQVVHRQAGQDVPIVGAAVQLAGAVAGAAPPAVISDASGRFEITRLLPGPVSVNVQATGFQDFAGEGTASVENPPPLSVVLQGTGRIAGNVVFAVDAKLPVSLAEIRVAGAAAPQARSDTSGHFQVTGLAPGEVRLEVTAAGFKPAMVSAQAGDSSISVALAGDATLVGEVLRADTKAPVANAEVRLPGTPFLAKTGDDGKFRIENVRSGPARINATAAGLAAVVTQDLVAAQETPVKLILAGTLTATGRVLDAQKREPLAGATVTVADLGLKVTTDAQGVYTLPGLAQGTFKVVASAPGTFPEAVDFEPTAERTKLDDLVLRPAASVKGKVVAAKGQKPLADAEVVVGEDGPRVTTDAQGEFSLSPLPVGSSSLRVTATDYFPSQVALELVAGSQNIDDIQLPRLAMFRGTVLRALDNKPLAGATIVLTETGEKTVTNQEGVYQIAQAPAGVVTIGAAAEGYVAQQWQQTLGGGPQKLEDALLEGNVPTQGVTIDSLDKQKSVPKAKLEIVVGDYRATVESKRNGGFDVGKLPANSLVEVTARAPGFQETKVSKRVTADDAWIEIPLLRFINLQGSVFDATSKNPISKARVTVTTSKESHDLTTDADGRFQLADVPPGDIDLRVAAAGYADERVAQKIDPKSASLDIPLKPLRKIDGAVFDASTDRKGIAGAKVQIKIGEFEQETTTSPSGNFTIKLPTGKGEANLSAPGFIRQSVPVEISATDRRQLILRMDRGRTLRGIVVNAVNNQPVARALVGIGVADMDRLTSLTDVSGEFEIESAPASTADLEVNVAGFEPLNTTVPAGSTAPLRIVLSPILADGEVRVVLTWDKQPPDLDAHLFGPAPGAGQFHVSFDNREAIGATLDVDAKKGFGPETITIRARTGTYRYLVAHNDSLGTNSGERLAASAAQVRVYYKGAKGNLVYPLPAKVSGPAWHVVDIVVDAAGSVSVKPANRFFKDLPAP